MLQRSGIVIEVAAGALLRDDGAVFMQQRRSGGPHGLLWEFPGGKLEPGEAAAEAAVRELREELAIVVAPQDMRYIASEHSGESAHAISLNLFACLRWQGEPQLLDAVAMGWFSRGEAEALPMPPLDRALLAKLWG